MGKLGIFLFVAAFLGISGLARADLNLIQEVERLRNSLPADDPSRVEIALRLADLYFYEAADAQKKADLDPAQANYAGLLKQANEYRLKSVNFYNEVAKGKSGSVLIKIQFQLARLYLALQRKKEAIPMWKALSEQRLEPKIRTEALLRMAEHYEEQENRSSSAEADRYFRASIAECNQGDLCAYVQYRHAWLLRNMEQLPEAIDKMQLALWDSKGQVREEALRDLGVFLAAAGGDGSSAMKIIEPLSAKLNRPALLRDLSDSFYSAGNKLAGTRILEIVNARRPSLQSQVKLLEEYYGLREWDKIKSLLSEMESKATPQLVTALEEVEGKEVEKILRRLTIQLDGERKSADERSGEFQSIALLYMSYFPQSDANPRIMESWLAAESDEQLRMAQLQTWLEGSSIPLSEKQRIHFHEVRASTAQKSKDHNTLLVEMKALSGLYKEPAKKREAEYLQARALYDLKKFEEALGKFQKLAVVEKGSADKWAILSKNLVLDILNERKDYAGIMQSADQWLNNKQLVSQATLKTELADMEKVREEASFQYAVSLGETAEALQQFKGFCLAKKYLPKSCENSKTLAVKLKDQIALLVVLEETQAKEDLINEYEASGEFVKAARLREEKLPLIAGKWSVEEALKISLLYELGGANKDRDRWLKGIAAHFSKNSFEGQPKGQEDLVYLTLDQAGMIDSQSLSIRWNEQRRKWLAHELEVRGLGNKTTGKILRDSKETLGPVWARYVLQGLDDKFQAQAKVNFYGRGSQSKFQLRVARLKSLEDYANQYLQGAGRETRLHILYTLLTAYQTFNQQIIETPIPEGLDEAALQQIKATLAEMAAPFAEIANKYQALASAEIAKLEDPASQQYYQAAFERRAELDLLKVTSAKAKPSDLKPVDQKALQSLLNRLKVNPLDASVLGALESLYKDAGQNRIAAYYRGRLEQTQAGLSAENKGKS